MAINYDLFFPLYHQNRNSSEVGASLLMSLRFSAICFLSSMECSIWMVVIKVLYVFRALTISITSFIIPSVSPALYDAVSVSRALDCFISETNPQRVTSGQLLQSICCTLTIFFKFSSVRPSTYERSTCVKLGRAVNASIPVAVTAEFSVKKYMIFLNVYI